MVYGDHYRAPRVNKCTNYKYNETWEGSECGKVREVGD